MAWLVGEAAPETAVIMETQVMTTWVNTLHRSHSTISYPNVDFVAPTDECWLQVALRWGLSTRIVITGPGEGANHKTGILMMTVYGPKGAGFATIDSLISGLASAFEGRNLSGIEFDDTDGPSEITTDPAWAGKQVSIRFRYFETVL